VTALSIATFFAWYYLGNNGAGHSIAQSIQIAITVLVIAISFILLLKTHFGYALRAIGENPKVIIGELN
jgi:ABC-type uncharacterized transport system permease subunit